MARLAQHVALTLAGSFIRGHPSAASAARPEMAAMSPAAYMGLSFIMSAPV